MFLQSLGLFATLASLLPAIAREPLPQAVPGVSGEITHSPPTPLPPTARVIVQLVNVLRASGPVTVIAQQVIEPRGAAPPYAFKLPYDQSQISEEGLYAVQAVIHDDKTPIFLLPRRVEVITGGCPSSAITIVLEPAARQR